LPSHRHMHTSQSNLVNILVNFVIDLILVNSKTFWDKKAQKYKLMKMYENPKLGQIYQSLGENQGYEKIV
jgi:hypothetical protein